MTTCAEPRSPTGVLLTTCTDEPAPTHVNSATQAPYASVPHGESIYRQDYDSHIADAAVSPIPDLLVVLGIIVGNLGFVASVALLIGLYAP